MITEDRIPGYSTYTVPYLCSISIMGHEQNPEETGIIPRFSDQLFKMTELKQSDDTEVSLPLYCGSRTHYLQNSGKVQCIN